jgi:hypothetical protein
MLNSKLPIRETLIQSWMCHPDWSLQDHIGYLDAEWWQTPDWRKDLADTPEDAEAQVRTWLLEL